MELFKSEIDWYPSTVVFYLGVLWARPRNGFGTLKSIQYIIFNNCNPIQFNLKITIRLTAVIEYDVALVDRSHYASSPLLVEVAVGKSSGGSASLGIQLSQTPIDTNLIHPSKNGRVPGGAIIIESIAPASIAERWILLINFLHVVNKNHLINETLKIYF